MIDFFRITIPNGYDRTLLYHPLLDFYSSINTDTGEERSVNREGQTVTSKKTAYYKDMRFIIFDTGRVIIDGSLHKYWNNGEHNFNDFHLHDVAHVLINLIETFKINPEHALITVLEVGLNIEMPYDINRIIEHFFFHKKKPFRWTETKTEGLYYQAKHNQYRIKLYNKTLQYSNHYDINRDLLRVEINYTGVQLRRAFNVSTLSDLMELPFSEFSESIKKTLSLSLFYDFTIQISSIRALKYANRQYWQDFIRNGQTSSYWIYRSIVTPVPEILTPLKRF